MAYSPAPVESRHTLPGVGRRPFQDCPGGADNQNVTAVEDVDHVMRPRTVIGLSMLWVAQRCGFWAALLGITTRRPQGTAVQSPKDFGLLAAGPKFEWIWLHPCTAGFSRGSSPG